MRTPARSPRHLLQRPAGRRQPVPRPSRTLAFRQRCGVGPGHAHRHGPRFRWGARGVWRGAQGGAANVL